MFEVLWMFVYAFLICASSYISFKGTVYYSRFGLKYYLVLSATSWIISAIFIAWHQGLFPSDNTYILAAISTIAITGIIFASSFREDDKIRTIGNFLKTLPLKDRILLRFPKDINLESLPVSPSPKISVWKLTAAFLVFISAFGSTLFMILISSIFLSVEFGFPMFSIFSILLWIAFVLILAEKFKTGGTLALVSSIGVMVLGSLLGIIFGIIGVLGGISSLMRYNENKSSK
ncbi:hypothetical protein J7K06_00995 [Candidatus Bathyarchaeota archaeon]|nr:hypothetical protein [Candidatus Bathyarchaeota archaeon]